MTAIWREDRQPNFDPFGRSMRIVTPPNTPANASHCTSNAPLPPSQSFVSIQSLYCGPWGDPLRRQFAHFQHWFPRPSLVHDHISTSNWPSNAALVIPKQDDDRDFDLKKKHMSRQVERNTLPIHRKSLPQSGIYRGELFTVGNSEIPDFCLSSLASRENPWFLNLSLPKEEGDKI